MRVLVIDGCPEFREVARRSLECEGFEVIEARDGLAGMQRAIEDSPDLILLDLGLSGLDGGEVCGRIREERETREIPIMIWSSPGDPTDRVLAIEAGACAYVARIRRSIELAEKARELIHGPSLEWTPPGGVHTGLRWSCSSSLGST